MLFAFFSDSFVFNAMCWTGFIASIYGMAFKRFFNSNPDAKEAAKKGSAALVVKLFQNLLK